MQEIITQTFVGDCPVCDSAEEDMKRIVFPLNNNITSEKDLPIPHPHPAYLSLPCLCNSDLSPVKHTHTHTRTHSSVSSTYLSLHHTHSPSTQVQNMPRTRRIHQQQNYIGATSFMF